MNKLLLPAAVMLSSSLAAIGTAHAANATTTLNVSATITSDCAVTTTAVNFGSVSAVAGGSATGSVDVTCNLNTPYTIALDAGANYGGASTRQITDSTSTYFLAYALNDAALSLPWGDGGLTIAGNTVAGSGTGLTVAHSINATLTGGTVPNGTYTDTVNVTVAY